MKLILGDALDVLRGMDSASVDVVITDPPYGISYQSARRIDRSKWKPKIANDASPFVWWLFDCARVLKIGGGLLCFCRWDVQEAFRLAIEWCGLSVRSQLIWDRVGHGAGDTAGSPAPCHDIVWYATKGRRVFHGRRPVSMLRFPRLNGESLCHSNQKPVELMLSLVGDYAVHGDTVLDPFMGSGTTGVVCVRTGRDFIGVEIDATYFEIAQKRIGAEEQRYPLFEQERFA